jgi:hypothetical protein
MAYTYKKLTDVALVESAEAPNLLIEEGGDIKKISSSNLVTPQTKADWEETDPNSAAFILNKPDLSQAGSANVVTYTIASGVLNLNGVTVTRQSVIDEWKNGSILRIDETSDLSGGSLGAVSNIKYTIASGTLASATVYYYSNGVLTSLVI